MKELVQSVDRALSIVEVLSDYEEGLGITEISSKIQLHKSTVHRLLSTLIYKGYVEQKEESNKYRVTLKLFELGNKRIEKMDILSIAKSYLKELATKTKEVVHLVLLEGNEIVYIDKMESESTIRMHSRIGKRSPVYCTAVGKAIMAYLPEDKVIEMWNNSNVEKLTEYTIVDFERMRFELDLIRKRKYSIDEQENELGVRCVSAPIFNHKGEPNWAISISGPTMRVTDEKVNEFGDLVIEISEKISSKLGYRG